MKRIFLLLILSLTIVSCSDESKKPPRDEIIKGVVRILMREPKNFTLLVRDSIGGRIKEKELNFYQTGVIITYVDDVPVGGEANWVVLHFDYTDRSPYSQIVTQVTFHIRSVEDINGAGWNHGKFGSGQTTVVQ